MPCAFVSRPRWRCGLGFNLNDELEETWGVRPRADGRQHGEVVAEDPRPAPACHRRRRQPGRAAGAGRRARTRSDRQGDLSAGEGRRHRSAPAVIPGEGQERAGVAVRLDEVEARAPGLLRRLDAPLVDRGARAGCPHRSVRASRAHARAAAGDGARRRGIGKSRLVKELVGSVEDRARILKGTCLPRRRDHVLADRPDPPPGGRRRGNRTGARGGSRTEGSSAERLSVGTWEPTRPARKRRSGRSGAPRGGRSGRAAARPARGHPLGGADAPRPDRVSRRLDAGAPILVVCPRTTDLLERPTWLAPHHGCNALCRHARGPWPAAECRRLPRRAPLRAAPRTGPRPHCAAGGRQPAVPRPSSVSSIRERRRRELAIPPSIQALLAARLDRLPAAERAVIECAAVVGREFPAWARGRSLLPKTLLRTRLLHLMALVPQGADRPDTAVTGHDDGFRFRHALIRDAAHRRDAKGGARRPPRSLRTSRGRLPGAPNRARGDRRLPPRAGTRAPVGARPRRRRPTLASAAGERRLVERAGVR